MKDNKIIQCPNFKVSECVTGGRGGGGGGDREMLDQSERGELEPPPPYKGTLGSWLEGFHCS